MTHPVLLTGLTLCLVLSAGCAGASSPGSALRHAAHVGDLATVRSELDAGVPVDSMLPGGGEVPLELAAMKGHMEIVNLLVERGADIGLSISICEETERWGVENSNGAMRSQGRSCQSILRSIKARQDEERRQQAESARDQAMGEQRAREMKELVREVVAATAQSPKEQAQPEAISSDVDNPSYKLPERPEDFALVVGIGKYSDIPEARFAQRDAEAVKDHLIAAGFPSRNVIQLFGEKAGRSSIEKFVETWLPRNIGESSRVLFYFSGHGAPDPKTGEAYLIPWDGDPGFLENTGYPIKRLYEKLSALKAREVVVVMDACFSGAGGRSVLAKGARPLVARTETAAVPRNLTVFAAASGDQITSTLEDQGHGTFTYYFLKGFSGGAKDDSGRVTTKTLYDYLKPKVQDAARRQNRDQEPVLRAHGDRELVKF